MWISKKKYDRITERLGDLERFVNSSNDDRRYEAIDRREIRAGLKGLSEQFRLLVESLGMVHQATPAKEAYVKKGGPERGE